MRPLALVLALLAGLTACDAAPPPPEAEEASPTPDEPDEAAPADEECADVSESQGAPAPLTMKDTFFEPTCLVVSSTQQITLANAGDLVHNLSIADTGMNLDVQPGDEVTTDDLGDEARAGTFEFFCRYHRDAGMVGSITIE